MEPRDFIRHEKLKLSYCKNKLSKKNTKFTKDCSIKIFSGNTESISCIKRHSRCSSLFFSGDSRGNIEAWSLFTRKRVRYVKAHSDVIKDLAINYKGTTLVSCSADRFLKIWSIDETAFTNKNYFRNQLDVTSLSAHPMCDFFLTTGTRTFLWDLNKLQPIRRLYNKMGLVSKATFNPFEFNIASCCAEDRSVFLCDLRLNHHVKKFFFNMSNNDISWSYVYPSQFTVANEDGNLYSFDIRNFSKIYRTFKGHFMPVTTLSRSPAGHLVASGSFDNTIRLSSDKLLSFSQTLFVPEMKKVYNIFLSLDSKCLVSASEDGTLRLWKNFEQNARVYASFFKKSFFKKKRNDKLCLFSLYSHCPIYTRAKVNRHKKNSSVSEFLLPAYINFKLKKFN
ncbi:nucleolar snRNP protein (nucleomorph) [Cryptomonas paramecium]|uniref:Nucleolar snRNP protein n=1 Tax=Cryptomonas paramaecium TaxID=2898 RepID=F2HHM8_9CRYP|nr:nucleolar snRNP protein [Cryptomonas paramecium]AEA38824.1 nucleolar snRNP protein [Cryptomonas paramecium]|mmetsp:Transcript_52165/g.136361  ORF Transcript_52165/g.136361 Transcript_52165/m.136361 type:complete len:394 (-) Transcript_52165:3377-4558(-)